MGLALLGTVFGLGRTTPVTHLVYSWQRDLRQRSLLSNFEGRNTAESACFVLHYDDSDSSWSALLLRAAEDARERVVLQFGASPMATAAAETSASDKTVVLLHSDPASLDSQFAFSPGLSALGAYWAGVIQILSPRHWLDARPPEDAAASALTGPLVHEYTHYLLDRMIPGGNCPRWLSEGLAQLTEYRETGYLWLEPDNYLTALVDPASLYSLADLTLAFDRLANPALAYREAFLLVSFFDEIHGPDGMGRLLGHLAGGDSFAAALRGVTGLSPGDWERAWLAWLEVRLERPGAPGGGSY